MNEKEIRIIARALRNLSRRKPHLEILEWGSGGSTVYFPNLLRERGVSYYWTSIEYNRAWYEKVKKEVGETKRTRLVLIDVGNHGLRQDGISMDEYVNYPATIGKKFDFVLVDGRKRKRCVKVARNLLAEGGVALLHDAQRAWYAGAFDSYPDSHKVSFRLHRGRIEPPPLSTRLMYVIHDAARRIYLLRAPILRYIRLKKW